MSVAEMKLAAIQEIGKLKNENDIKNILEQLLKLSSESEPMLHLSGHYDKIKAQYGDVLQKLAQ